MLSVSYRGQLRPVYPLPVPENVLPQLQASLEKNDFRIPARGVIDLIQEHCLKNKESFLALLNLRFPNNIRSDIFPDLKGLENLDIIQYTFSLIDTNTYGVSMWNDMTWLKLFENWNLLFESFAHAAQRWRICVVSVLAQGASVDPETYYNSMQNCIKRFYIEKQGAHPLVNETQVVISLKNYASYSASSEAHCMRGNQLEAYYKILNEKIQQLQTTFNAFSLFQWNLFCGGLLPNASDTALSSDTPIRRFATNDLFDRNVLGIINGFFCYKL